MAMGNNVISLKTHKTLVTQMLERDRANKDRQAREIANRQHIIKSSFVEGLKLLVMIWQSVETKEEWLAGVATIKRAQAVSEELKLAELVLLFSEMAELAQIRADMEPEGGAC